MVEESLTFCKICTVDYDVKATAKIQQCQCVFSKECLHEYLGFEIKACSYAITCPDSNCLKKAF